MKFLVASVDRAGPNSPEMELFNRYATRLRGGLTLIECVAKNATNLNVEERMQAECELLAGLTAKCGRIIALDPRGKLVSSQALAAQIQGWEQEGISQVGCWIGGADGLTEDLRKKAHLVVSFGPMVWPHLMVRAMLAEQFYRAHCITQNHPYHRG